MAFERLGAVVEGQFLLNERLGADIEVPGVYNEGLGLIVEGLGGVISVPLSVQRRLSHQFGVGTAYAEHPGFTRAKLRTEPHKTR